MAMKRKNRVAETETTAAIKNLSQLKQLFRKGGATFKITAHRRPECVGEIRTVTRAGSTGFYSKVYGGKELWCTWETAKHWEFGDECTIYATPEKKEIVMSFKTGGDEL